MQVTYNIMHPTSCRRSECLHLQEFRNAGNTQSLMEVLLLSKGMDGSQSALLNTSLYPLAGTLHACDHTYGCLWMRKNLVHKKEWTQSLSPTP